MCPEWQISMQHTPLAMLYVIAATGVSVTNECGKFSGVQTISFRQARGQPISLYPCRCERESASLGVSRTCFLRDCFCRSVAAPWARPNVKGTLWRVLWAVCLHKFAFDFVRFPVRRVIVGVDASLKLRCAFKCVWRDREECWSEYRFERKCVVIWFWAWVYFILVGMCHRVWTRIVSASNAC